MDEENDMQSETPSQRKKRLEKRNANRNTVCTGCRHNYYNFPKPQSASGDVAVAEDYSCYHLNLIKRGKCVCKS